MVLCASHPVLLAAAASLLLLSSCTSQAPRPNDPPALAAIDRINLGSRLFLPGSNTMTPEGEATVATRLAEVPSGAPLIVQVFGDSRSLTLHHTRPETIERLSRLRAEALGEYLHRRGFEVTETRGRGLDRVDGQQPDRRAIVYVLGR